VDQPGAGCGRRGDAGVPERVGRGGGGVVAVTLRRGGRVGRDIVGHFGAFEMLRKRFTTERLC
jgi:hypothetical protein